MDSILEAYQNKFVLSKNRVLSEVDEWLLWVYYIQELVGTKELQLRITYNSPIRDIEDYDSSPSFSIFENTRSKKECSYLWKDGAKNLSGDIFELLSKVCSISEYEVLSMISNDFAIMDDSKEVKAITIVQRPASKLDSRIRIKSKPFTKEALDYWNSYYIPKELLDWKQVRLVEYLWFNDEQQYPIKPKSLTFAYAEYNFKYKDWRYQIYSPFEKKEWKFKNNMSQNQIYGYNHIKYDTDKLIITKSNKDIICLKKFGIAAVSPRSETTRIKDKTVKLLQSKYKFVYSLFDNDETGKKSALGYDLPSLFIPEISGYKDFSDFLQGEGEIRAKELLKELRIL